MLCLLTTSSLHSGTEPFFFNALIFTINLRISVQNKHLNQCKTSTSNGWFDSSQDEDNGAWLEEVAVRMLCLLSLDRFGDFVSDQVS